MPYELLSAVEHADLVCSWQENLPAKEVPPRWMWPFPVELNKWFEKVDADRKEGTPEEDTTKPRAGDNALATRRLNQMRHQRRKPARR